MSAVAAGKVAVEVTATNDGLKKKLEESRLALNSFAKAAATKLGPAGGALKEGMGGGAGIMGGLAAAGGALGLATINNALQMMNDKLASAVKESDRLNASFAKLIEKRYQMADKQIGNDPSGSAFKNTVKELDDQIKESEKTLNRYKKALDDLSNKDTKGMSAGAAFLTGGPNALITNEILKSGTAKDWLQAVGESVPLVGDQLKLERTNKLAEAEKNLENQRKQHEEAKARRTKLEQEATNLADGYVKSLQDEQNAISGLPAGYEKLAELRRYGAKQEDIDRVQAKIDETEGVKKLMAAYKELQTTLKGVDASTEDIIRNTQALNNGEDSTVSGFRKQMDDVRKKLAESDQPSWVTDQASASLDSNRQALIDSYKAQQAKNLKDVASKMPEFGALGGQNAAGLWQKMGPGTADKTFEEVKKTNVKLQEQIDILKNIQPLTVQP